MLMQAMLMLKTGKAVGLKFCMETGLPPGKYNSFVNPFISCKTDIIISNKCYNVLYMHVYTMQELVITLKNHGNNGLEILHGNVSS